MGRKPSKDEWKMFLDDQKQQRRPYFIKIYMEQIPELDHKYRNYPSPYLADGITPNPYYIPHDEISDMLKKYLKAKISAVSPEDYFVCAIVHDADTVGDVVEGVWTVANEKPHVHIVIWKNGDNRLKLSTVYNLLGISFRDPKEDKVIDHIIKTDDEWYRHCIDNDCTWEVDAISGTSTIHYPDDTVLIAHKGIMLVKDIPNCLTYLLHDTEDAISQGKTKYSESDLICNDMDTYKKYYEEYFHSLTCPKSWEDRENQFFTWGYELRDLWDLEKRYPPHVRSKREYKECVRAYYAGIDQNISDNPNVNRLCVYIQSPPGFGKTYFARNKIPNSCVIDGGKSGKFDKLKPSHDALVINDAYAENFLNLSDNYKVSTYRRNANNAYFCGNLLLVLSNEEFKEYMENTEKIDPEQLDALKSRFYICKVILTDGTYKLLVLSPCVRGTQKDIENRENRFNELRSTFEMSLKEYQESGGDIDLVTYKKSIKEKYQKECPDNESGLKYAKENDLIEELPYNK